MFSIRKLSEIYETPCNCIQPWEYPRIPFKFIHLGTFLCGISRGYTLSVLKISRRSAKSPHLDGSQIDQRAVFLGRTVKRQGMATM